MTSSMTHTLSVNPDVYVDVKPQVAGIVLGRMQSDWIECTFTIRRAPPGKEGVVWEALFGEKDTGRAHPFSGTAKSHRHGTQVVTNVLTAAIQNCVQERVRQQGLQLVDYGGVTAKAPGLLGWLRRVWVRIRALWSRA